MCGLWAEAPIFKTALWWSRAFVLCSLFHRCWLEAIAFLTWQLNYARKVNAEYKLKDHKTPLCLKSNISHTKQTQACVNSNKLFSEPHQRMFSCCNNLNKIHILIRSHPLIDYARKGGALTYITSHKALKGCTHEQCRLINSHETCAGLWWLCSEG